MINKPVAALPLSESLEGPMDIILPPHEPIILKASSLQLPLDDQSVRKLIEACSFGALSRHINDSTYPLG